MGGKNPKPRTMQSFILFTLCFSTFPSPSTNQPASKFAVQIKWANDNPTVRWSLHKLKVFQPPSVSKEVIQVLLAQFRILPVTAGSEELLKQLLEARVKVYTSSAVTLQCLPVVTCHTNWECYLQLALWSMGKCTCESREQIEKTLRASSRVCVKSIKPSQSNHWLSAGLSFKMFSQPQRLQKSKGSFPQSP